MLKLTNVTKIYKKKIKAVDDLSLEIKQGEIFGLLGPNGAGKSTTIKMLAGILDKTQGLIEFDGQDIDKLDLDYKQIINYVPDNPDIYKNMTGMKYLNFLADIYNVSIQDRKNIINYYNEQFELGDAIYDPIESYSHGMRQKLVLIGAFINSPKVLILDEPMVGLDVKTSFNLKNILRTWADNGNIVIFSTHVMEVAQKLCDRVAIINKGKLIMDANPQEILENKDLEQLFLELTEHE